MSHAPPSVRAVACQRGFTLVEAIVSTVVVATMLVASLNAAGMAATSRAKVLWRVQGQQLASALMAELLTKPYEDPEDTTLVLGLDSGESAGDRTTFNDLDDFAGYQQQPPQGLDGQALMNESSWKWSVVVEWVNPSAPGSSALILTESGAKRIKVTVSRNGVPLATLTGLRTNLNY
ncbi:MAG: prepilin-type N-terminal cleavage/methylation domain-containing protein [bacterium]|nr:prepilin-type N-terminal cleavage/methylation domain-containing protein [bacterium]